MVTLTDKIYPNLHQAGLDISWLKQKAVFTLTNDLANNINNFLLEKLSTEKIKYESVDTIVEEEDNVRYPIEFSHTLNSPGVPTYTLYLKIVAPI